MTHRLLPIHADRWKPLANEIAEWRFDNDQTLRYRLFTVDSGELCLKSGRLVACDPFAMLQWQHNAELEVPPGRYPVVTTVADISDELDGSHLREAYLSLVLSDLPAAGWRFLAPARPDDELPELGEHEFIPVPVDAGTVAFVDAEAVERLMPDPSQVDWKMEYFDTGEPDAWFARMDDPAHLRAGCANIALPRAQDGENIVLSHSGWGDGSYAVVGTYAADGTLTGIHIDLTVLPLAPLPEWD